MQLGNGWRITQLLSAAVLMTLVSGVAVAQKYSKQSVERTASRLETRTDEFQKDLKRAMNDGRGGLNNTSREDDLNAKAGKLEREVDQIKKEIEREKSYKDIQSNVRKAADAARDINATMRRRNMGRALEDDWRRVLVELNSLCGLFNVQRVNW
jgi:hypothetical protein